MSSINNGSWAVTGVHLTIIMLIIRVLSAKQCEEGEWENARFVIQRARRVNTTVVRNVNQNSKDCTWKFLIHFPQEKNPSLACLAFDSGRGPALESSRLLAYGKDFREIKVTRPMIKLAPFVFSGSIVGDAESAVVGTIARSGFLGQVRKGTEIFYIEKQAKYLKLAKKSSNDDKPDTDTEEQERWNTAGQIVFTSKDLQAQCLEKRTRSRRDLQSLAEMIPPDLRSKPEVPDELDENLFVEEMDDDYDEALLPEDIKEQLLPETYTIPTPISFSKSFDKNTLSRGKGDEQGDADVAQEIHLVADDTFPSHDEQVVLVKLPEPQNASINEKPERANHNEVETKHKNIAKQSPHDGYDMEPNVPAGASDVKTQEEIFDSLAAEIPHIFDADNSRDFAAAPKYDDLTAAEPFGKDEIISDEDKITERPLFSPVSSSVVTTAASSSGHTKATEPDTSTTAHTTGETAPPVRTAQAIPPSPSSKQEKSIADTVISGSDTSGDSVNGLVIRDNDLPPFVEAEDYQNQIIENSEPSIPTVRVTTESVQAAQVTRTKPLPRKEEEQTKASTVQHPRGLLGLNGGMIWEVTLACDYRFYSHDGDENIGIAIGRMLYLFDMAEWVIRSADWNSDQLPDNLGFKLKDIAIEMEPGELGNEIERFRPVTEETTAQLVIALSSGFSTSDFHTINVNTQDGNSRGQCGQRLLAIVPFVDSVGRALPDAIVGHRILMAVLRFLQADETTSGHCNEESGGAEDSAWSLLNLNHCERKRVKIDGKNGLGPCSTKATVAYCGNGILEPGEECDCGSLSSCWSTTKHCCNPRGNVLTQCKLTTKSECYDPAGVCCDLRTCQRMDLSREGLSCVLSHVCWANVSNTGTVMEGSKSCGALVAENMAGIQTECSENKCQSRECTRLGLKECVCSIESMDVAEYPEHCGTCCQLSEALCVTSLTAMELASLTLSQSYQKHLKENFLIHNGQTFREFIEANVTIRKMWESLNQNGGGLERGGSTLVNPVDVNALYREFCVVTDDPETCFNISFLRWPTERPCVVHGAVSKCGADRICKLAYQALSTPKHEIGLRQQMIKEWEGGFSVTNQAPSILLCFYGTIMSLTLAH